MFQQVYQRELLCCIREKGIKNDLFSTRVYQNHLFKND